MPAPLAPAKRAAILADIEAGKPRNQIARDHSVSGSTVTKLARTVSDEPFDRSQALKATRAQQADNKTKRAQLQSDLLDDAQKLRERAWKPYKIVVGSAEGAEIVQLDLPPLPDVRAAYTSIGIIVDKSVVIEKHDSGDDAEAARSVLSAVLENLTVKHGDGS